MIQGGLLNLAKNEGNFFHFVRCFGNIVVVVFVLARLCQ